jgi:hypothetical protein
MKTYRSIYSYSILYTAREHNKPILIHTSGILGANSIDEAKAKAQEAFNKKHPGLYADITVTELQERHVKNLFSKLTPL